MNIGILTFQFADNYGAVLQAYALKRTLECQGNHNVHVINYVGESNVGVYSINPFKAKDIKTFLKRCLLLKKRYTQAKKFDSFRSDYLEIDKNICREIDYDKYDMIVAGSDQIWSFPITNGDLTYFLPKNDDINDHCVRISYGASANDSFPESEKKYEIGRCLLNFKDISVREEQIQRAIKNEYGFSSEVVCDPVFLKSREFWERTAKFPKGLPERYILVYTLKTDITLDENAKEISKEIDIPIITIHPLVANISTSGRPRKDIGPLEFIGMILKAEVVVSNSFHAFAFSLLFSKKIIFSTINGSANRILNLIEALTIKTERIDDKTAISRLNVYGSDKYNSYVKKSQSFINNNLLLYNNKHGEFENV